MNKQEINEFSMRISQSNKTQVVVITYEIIINYLDSARESLDNKDETNFVFNVKKARQFLSQLSGALDFKYGISYELMSLYMFANECMVKSEIRKSDVNLEQVKNILIRLREAFEEVSKIDKGTAVMQGGEKVYQGLTYGRNGLGTVMVSK